MRTILQDVSYGPRTLARNRGFTLAAVVAIAAFACLVPTRHALQVDPAIALRDE